MADPVTFPFRPDWSARVVERMEWRTEILGSIVGAEQAIATRYAMRRSIEARILAEGNERSFLALMLERLGTGEFRVPLWFHRAKLGAAVSVGATTLACDTLHREFRAGDFALLVGPDAFTTETVEIDAVTDTALTLAAGLDRDWAAGTVVHPLRTARLTPTPLRQVTDRVAETSVRFTIEAGEDVDGGTETWTEYAGFPVMGLVPNWAEPLEVTLARLQDEHDSKVGLSILADTAGRAFRTTRHGYLLDGREAQADFRNLLRRLRGRQGRVWMPTLARDVTLADAAATGATALEIERIGLTEAGGLSDEIAHLLFRDGTALEWTALEAPANPANERLTLAAAAARDFSAGERASFLQAARLDQDTVTITHETDSDGVATTQIAWTAVDGSRDGSASGAFPIPETAMTSGGCCDNNACALQVQIYATTPFSLPEGYFVRGAYQRYLADFTELRAQAANDPVNIFGTPQDLLPGAYSTYMVRDEVNQVHDFYVAQHANNGWEEGEDYWFRFWVGIYDGVNGLYVDDDASLALLRIRYRFITIARGETDDPFTLGEVPVPLTTGAWTEYAISSFESGGATQMETSVDADTSFPPTRTYCP